jgi:cephalosporin hydroxylase
MSVAKLWRERIAVHEHDSYRGVPIHKFPEDLWIYEKLIWERRPHVLVEVGIERGGSTLWFSERVTRVIGVDVDCSGARARLERVRNVELVEGNIRDRAVVDEVVRQVADAEVMVVEDAAHDYKTTKAALEGLAPLIRPGGFYVVEDTCVDVDELRVDQGWPRGCGRALTDWLESSLGRRFRRRNDLQVYGLTCHPGGIIQRRWNEQIERASARYRSRV